jgi:DNA helicase-2/ATP-dependent DNA helicase PcrA
VEELADRDQGERGPKAAPYCNLIPLEDILAETLKVGAKSQKVSRAYEQLIHDFGSEFDILCEIPCDALTKSRIPLLDEAVARMRQGRVVFDPGYDGEFGRVSIFGPDERERLQGQACLFDSVDEGPLPSQLKDVGAEHCARPAPMPSRSQASADTDPDPPLLFAEAESSGFLLNAEQQAAVDHKTGPLLIDAGPGTGKTRTITCRMAELMQKRGIAAGHILAVTFTNKAADEMRRRLQPAAETPLTATFHGLCWRLLQELYGEGSGSIVDDTGRRVILADALDRVTHDQGRKLDLTVESALDRIVQAKQLLLGPSDDLRDIADETQRPVFTAVYAAYQQLLELQQLYDFEDLLFQVVRILEEDHAWRRQLQKRFTHIFVDEFQDINLAQYRLLRALAPSGAQLCVIGDPDQAIYGFRGSDVHYFHQFRTDYSDTRVIRLTRNYRSTETILASAVQVIQAGPLRRTQNDQGRIYSNIQGIQTLTILETASERAEAVAIGQTIEQMVGGLGFHSVDFDKLDGRAASADRSFNDFAVLCRTGDQVRRIFRQLSDAGIPCQMAHHSSLRHPAVLKLLAALRVITHQGSYADLHQLIGLSAPGIGQQTLAIFKRWAYARQLPLTTAIHSAHRLPIPGLSIPRQQRLTAFFHLLERLQKETVDMDSADTMAHIVRQTTLSSQVEPEDLVRLSELARPFARDKSALGVALALQQDTDLYRPGVQQVAVMTLHAAKGLEFPVVFVAGCEDNLLPLRRPGNNQLDVEEERRLFYVGLTRAREQLFLTRARRRTLYGQTLEQNLSPFVADIEAQLKKHITSQGKPQKPQQEQLTLF